MMILDPYGMTFGDMGVFGMSFNPLFRSGSTYCGVNQLWVSLTLALWV